MNNRKIFPACLYFRKFINTFLPKFFFRCLPNRYWTRRHWKSQNLGDPHGCDKYLVSHPRVPVIISEIRSRMKPVESVLDLGCNCGYYLSHLKREGYRNLHGIDISPVAIQYGKEHLDLSGIDLTVGSFEEVLPQLAEKKIQFDLVYTLGATVELVHPSFDIISYMGEISRRYVVLIISESSHSYPRFWEYEFNRNGFLLIKCIRPYNGEWCDKGVMEIDTLMVFERVRAEFFE